MQQGVTTIQRFIAEEHRRIPGAAGELAALLADLVGCIRIIASSVERAALPGAVTAAGDGVENVHGERQTKLDVLANEVILRGCEWSGALAAMASEELELPYPIPTRFPRGKYLLAFDPLDGSSNLDVNVSVGTIFSVLRRRGSGPTVAAEELLQPGVNQVCAGYAIYGPSTMIVLTFGRGVHGFTLDRCVGEFVLTHPDMRIPDEAREFAINASNQRFWELPVKRYVSECLAGRTGPRAADFNMRWVASLVAEVHRILVRGGLFLYPRDTKEPARAGRLRLLYEASPMAMIVEAAGGAASTGRQRILDVLPTDVHERVPVILGSRAEVERVERYHREHEQGKGEPYRSPLFNARSLFIE